MIDPNSLKENEIVRAFVGSYRSHQMFSHVEIINGRESFVFKPLICSNIRFRFQRDQVAQFERV